MSRSKKMLPVLGQAPLQSPPILQEAEGSASAENLQRTIVRVEGMDCASCASTVERLDAEHTSSVTLEQIEGAVEEAGFSVARLREVGESNLWRRPRILSTITSAIMFALGLSLWLMGAPGVAQVAAYATAIVVGGMPIFRAALAGLRAGNLDMHVLMSAATVGAAGIGQWTEAASVVVLFAAGNALQVYAVDRTRGAVRALAQLVSDEVLVRRGEVDRIIPVQDVSVGETVVVRPGERLAIDGEIVEGRTTLDEATVTGENAPVEKGPGDGVFSGSLNGAGGCSFGPPERPKTRPCSASHASSKMRRRRRRPLSGS
jgi:Cd2+/Zn2+-exporting ATPase